MSKADIEVEKLSDGITATQMLKDSLKTTIMNREKRDCIHAFIMMIGYEIVYVGCKLSKLVCKHSETILCEGNRIQNEETNLGIVDIDLISRV